MTRRILSAISGFFLLLCSSLLLYSAEPVKTISDTVIFDGGLVWTAVDPAPLPMTGAELKVFVPGSKPADPKTGDPPDPEYSIVFYRIEAPAVVISIAGR